MSLAKLKAKEIKGKQKVLPKLKAILANPNKTKCPILDEVEMKDLKCLLTNAFSESNLDPKTFAIQKGISLGLESCLRKINSSTSCCVFISLSIKPNHIISLIARNAEVQDATQPVYAQPKLENFIEEIFGIQALCMVFSKNLMQFNDNINKWVLKRKRPAKLIKSTVPEKKRIVKNKLKTNKIKTEIKNVEKTEEKKTKVIKQLKPLSGDFISFGKDNYAQAEDNKLDGDQAVDALSEIINKIPTLKSKKPKENETSMPMEVDDGDLPSSTKKNLMDADDSEISDDFLGDYKSLTVHKIKGNPNKNPKKKRKKNKKKQPAK